MIVYEIEKIFVSRAFRRLKINQKTVQFRVIRAIMKRDDHILEISTTIRTKAPFFVFELDTLKVST